jgi:carboxyl-terminal processing protease
VRFTALPVSLLLASSLVAGPDDGAIDREVKHFIDVYNAIDRQAADPVDPSHAFYEGAIPGMLRKLDPHTVFFDPGQFEQLKQMEQSTQKGFGSVVSLLPGRVIVLQTLPGTPSQKSGIAPGDEILAINNIRLDRLDIEQLVQLLGQSRQQNADLVVRRPGSARLLQFVLTPENMESPSVDRAFFLKPGLGYVRVTSFDEKTGKLLKQAIEKLGGDKLAGLVLDLRNNPGGVVGAAIETASQFLKPGQRVLSVKGRSIKGEEVDVPSTATPYRFPLAVLMNAKSASASEIVAGSLQDHDRAVVIGEPSFGKGLVQSVFPLSSGTGLALTTAFYYTPSGRSIQKHLTGQLDEATTQIRAEATKDFHSDSGRIIKGGSAGGILPDQVVYPESMTRLRAVLDASASFTSFATEYLGKSGPITEKFEVTSGLLDDFQVTLAQRNIQPGIAEWSHDREWIRQRLKQEIFNQSLGVEKGDEIEAQIDPQVQAAVSAVERQPALHAASISRTQ